MRVAIAVLACLLAVPALLAAQDASAPVGSPVPVGARGDALRQAGDFAAALSAYREEIAARGESALLWKRIAWAARELHQYNEAARSFQKALALDPQDQEARDDLAGMRGSRGLAVRGWYGGSEPGTSAQSGEGQLWYGGFNGLELTGGGGWVDEIFYQFYKANADGRWFYAPGSYAVAGLSLRKYDYSAASSPVPDSNAYHWEPRAEIGISHLFARTVRVGFDYQIELPNFFYDQATWFTTHKVTGDVELTLAGFQVSATVGMLADPAPNLTVIKGSPGNPGVAATSVVYDYDMLFGAGISYDAPFWGAGVKLLTNRDLDMSYDWSVLSSVSVRPLSRLSVDLQWTFDHYSVFAGPLFQGNFGNIVWGQARYEILRGIILGAGAKWVSNPGPTSVTNPAARNGLSLLLNVEYKTGLF